MGENTLLQKLAAYWDNVKVEEAAYWAKPFSARADDDDFAILCKDPLAMTANDRARIIVLLRRHMELMRILHGPKAPETDEPKKKPVKGKAKVDTRQIDMDLIAKESDE
jgi:hypothetical protein